MHAYKFRVTSDDHDEFLREIEVLANQSFEDFHRTLVASCKFAGNELASFYLCDNQWRKKHEITLMDMGSGNGSDDGGTTIMKDARLNKIINDPHQKIIYVYDYLSMFTLYIELVKIGAADMTIQYPRVLKEVSDIMLPQLNKTAMVDEEEVIDEEDLRAQLGEEEETEGDDFMGEEESFYEDDSSL